MRRAVFLLGFLTDLGPIKNWGFRSPATPSRSTRAWRPTSPASTARATSCTYDGKLKLIATGFGEAAIAVNHAKAHIDPTAKVNPGHSSETVPPKPGH